MTRSRDRRPPLSTLRRWSLVLAGVLVAAGVLTLVVWVVPAWLTQQPVLPGVQRYQAMADVRTGLLATLGALGACGGLVYTARTFRLSQIGQLTSRFESASKQMGDDDQTVRLAGIHAMAQLADEWATQRQTCIDVLCAFLRVTGTPTQQQPDDLREARRTTLRIIKVHLIQQRDRISWQGYEFDLTGAVLKEADFTGITFAGARFLFEDVQFEEGVSFDEATFAGSYVSFRGARLSANSCVSFVKASFRSGEVVFDGVTFGGGEARFDRAVFKSDCLVTFKGAQLGAGGSVYFKDATVEGPGLCFTNACFSRGEGEVRFDHATFSGTVKFDGAEFRRVVHFDSAKFVGAKLIFAGAKLRTDRISFDGADCRVMTINLKNAVEGRGSIDLRRAKGRPQITGTASIPSLVLTAVTEAGQGLLDTCGSHSNDEQPPRSDRSEARIQGGPDGDRPVSYPHTP